MNSPMELDFSDEPAEVESSYVECKHEQGSEEWHLDRLGIPTGTGFSKIITTAGKPSTSAKGYMNQLLADWRAGKPVDAWEGNENTKNGNEREPQARELYEFITDEPVSQIGFCFRNAKKETGVSPDGLVSKDGLVEIKCPKGATLIDYILADKIPTTYFQQIQGQLWVMDKQWCDFFAWHPDIGHFKKRMMRDDKFIAELAKAVESFNYLMKEKRDILGDR